MSTNLTGQEPEMTPTNSEAPLFAANPVWERRGKKRGFGARKTAAPAASTAPQREVAPEPRSFASDPRPTSAAAVAPAMARADAVTPSTPAAAQPAAAPFNRTRAVKRSSGPSPALIGGAVGAVALLAVGGWYASQPRDGGVPELTPGVVSEELATAPVEPPEQLTAANVLPQRAAPAPMQIAQAPTQPPASRPAPPARTRPADSASDQGVNASTTATLPAGPQPYATLNPGAEPAAVAPTQVNPPLAPAPAPLDTAPPVIPSTPPIAPEPAPTPDTPPT